MFDQVSGKEMILSIFHRTYKTKYISSHHASPFIYEALTIRAEMPHKVDLSLL
jgi:hypothetical protein